MRGVVYSHAPTANPSSVQRHTGAKTCICPGENHPPGRHRSSPPRSQLSRNPRPPGKHMIIRGGSRTPQQKPAPAKKSRRRRSTSARRQTHLHGEAACTLKQPVDSKGQFLMNETRCPVGSPGDASHAHSGAARPSPASLESSSSGPLLRTWRQDVSAVHIVLRRPFVGRCL